MLVYFPLSILKRGLHKFNRQMYKFTINPSLDKFKLRADYSRLPNFDLPKLPIMAA